MPNADIIASLQVRPGRRGWIRWTRIGKRPTRKNRDAAGKSPIVTDLPISETFTSIQGEGLLAGVPSFFVRLSGCNLRCRWCDTPYASWQPETRRRALDDLLGEARASGVRHAVLTGGEPMMFPELVELSARLAGPESAGGAGMHITVETAGTIIPGGFLERGRCDLVSISPKLANSTPRADPRDPLRVWEKRHEERRINPGVLQTLLDAFPAPRRQLKFVFSDPADLAEIDALLAGLRGWAPSDVLLMPEGVTPPSPERKAAAVRACLERGYRYCARLHIELFGNTRGT
jgi:7-carboxy-7-deazaguanine synthase